jgi:hypothetical protein
MLGLSMWRPAVAEIIEFDPRREAIRKEMASLRALHVSLMGRFVVTENGVDVTARERELLGAQIDALNAILIDILGTKSKDADRT